MLTTPAWIPDYSAVQAFRENPEMFRIKYRLHLVSTAPEDKMRAGSALHAGRNVLFEARRLGATAYSAELVDEAAAVARAFRGEAPGFRDANHVERLMRAYAVVYATEPFEVVSNERYEQALIHGVGCKQLESCGDGAYGCFMYCGIIDACLRFPDDSEYIMDTKSTGAYLGEPWETTARLSDQFVGYVALRRALGKRCDGFLVDGIHIVDPKPRKDGSYGEPNIDLEKHFVRVGPVPVPEWRVERWVRDMQYTLAQIAELERTRGIDTPWPIYGNWLYGKVDGYREFYEQPAELHEQVAQMFERRQWSPSAVAEERKVTT